MVGMETEHPAKRGEAHRRLLCSREQVPPGGKTMPEVTGNEKDMNLGLKTLSKEYLKKVESGDYQNRLVSSEELNIQTKDQEEGQRKKAVKQVGKKLIVRSAALLRKKTAQGVWMKLILLSAALLLVASRSQAATLIPTEQILPPDCLHWLKLHGNDCRDTSSFDRFWAHLNEICCKGYPGVFHCQMEEVNFTTYSIAACLPELSVPPGKVGKLIKNETGYPELDMDLDCPPGEYRSKSTKSSSIWSSSCKMKTVSRPEEEKICDGGPTADHRFVCRVGYNASCRHGFNDDHDSCFCERLQCRGGKPFRNLTGLCIDGSIGAEYGCTTDSTSGPLKSTLSPPVPSSPDPTRNTNATATSHDQDVNLSAGPVAGIVVGIVVCFGIIGICLWQYSKRPNNSQASSASGSPGCCRDVEKDALSLGLLDANDAENVFVTGPASAMTAAVE